MGIPQKWTQQVEAPITIVAIESWPEVSAFWQGNCKKEIRHSDILLSELLVFGANIEYVCLPSGRFLRTWRHRRPRT